MTLGENTQAALDEYAKDTVKFAKINIGAKKRYKRSSGRTTLGRIDTTGALRNSLGYVTSQSKNSFTVKIGAQGKAAKYADVVESGRRKGKFIPLAELTKYIRDKRIKIKDKDGRFTKVTEGGVRQMARNISKNAKENGIPGKHYLKDASDKSFEKHKENLEAGLFLDMEAAAGHLIRGLERGNTR